MKTRVVSTLFFFVYTRNNLSLFPIEMVMCVCARARGCFGCQSDRGVRTRCPRNTTVNSLLILERVGRRPRYPGESEKWRKKSLLILESLCGKIAITTEFYVFFVPAS